MKIRVAALQIVVLSVQMLPGVASIGAAQVRGPTKWSICSLDLGTCMP